MSYIKFGKDWTKKVDFLCLFIIISFPSYERPHRVNHFMLTIFVVEPEEMSLHKFGEDETCSFGEEDV